MNNVLTYKTNIGEPERLLRATVGALLLAIVLIVDTLAAGAVAAATLAAIPLVISAIIGWSPIYAAVGASSVIGDPRRYAGAANAPHRSRWNWDRLFAKNLFPGERAWRAAIAAVLIAVPFTMGGPLGLASWLMLLAVPLVITAITARDPLVALIYGERSEQPTVNGNSSRLGAVAVSKRTHRTAA